MSLKPYIEPKDRLPYAKRMRNRRILIGTFLVICLGIAACIFSKDNEYAKMDDESMARIAAARQVENQGDSEINVPSESATKKEAKQTETPKEQVSAEKVSPTAASVAATTAPVQAEAPATQDAQSAEAPAQEPPQPETIDSTHIKNQKNVLMAEKIDNLLRAFKPNHAFILMVDPVSNEIIAWGERKDQVNQSKPDYLSRSTFPAASLAKTITVASALENNRYSLNSNIPMIGHAHKLYRNQLDVPKNYKGPFMEMQEAYAKSANPPLGIIGQNLGAKRLRSTASKLGYNMNFAGNLPMPASYTPPDTGFGLAETACGFTDATTISPLLAAAQVRAILMKMPLEIPWASNLDGFAPKKRIALNVGKFNENTYYGLRQAMVRTITNGTASKNISTKHMARKNYENLVIGGKTGSLDGKDPYGRYDWFMGFAQSKEDAKKALVLVVVQIYDPQEARPQPTTQVAGMLINYWAHQNLWNK